MFVICVLLALSGFGKVLHFLYRIFKIPKEVGQAIDNKLIKAQ